MSISNASPLPETLTPATGGQVDPADLARKTQANFDALALRVGTMSGTHLSGPYEVNYGPIGAGGVTNVTVTAPISNLTWWIPLGAFYAPGASGYGQTWGYDSPGTNQVRIYIADAFGSGAPAGKFFFALVGGVA
jgi:hypothetical protein